MKQGLGYSSLRSPSLEQFPAIRKHSDFAKGVSKWTYEWMNLRTGQFFSCLPPLRGFRRPVSGFHIHLAAVSKESWIPDTPGDHKGNGVIYHPTRVRCVPPGARPNVDTALGKTNRVRSLLELMCERGRQTVINE